MNFIGSTKSYFVNWLDFQTRSSRSEYWWGYLGGTIVGLLVGIGCKFITEMLDWSLETLVLPLLIYLFIAGLSLAVRRLHDSDKTGWWLLISFSLVGLAPLLYWYCKKGDEGENRFGPNPLEDIQAGSLSEG